MLLMALRLRRFVRRITQSFLGFIPINDSRIMTSQRHAGFELRRVLKTGIEMETRFWHLVAGYYEIQECCFAGDRAGGGDYLFSQRGDTRSVGGEFIGSIPFFGD